MRVSVVTEIGPEMGPADLRGLCINFGKLGANKVYCHNRRGFRNYYPCKEYYLVKVLKTKEVG